MTRLRTKGTTSTSSPQHEANRGFLRSLHTLGQAAAAIGEDDEAARCDQFLRDSSPAAAAALGAAGA